MRKLVFFKRCASRFDDVLDFSEDDNATGGVCLRGKPTLGLLVPVLNGTPAVTIDVSLDGTNWYALKNADGSTASISVTGGSAAFFVSSSVLAPLAAYVGEIRGSDGVFVRLATSVAQTSDRIFTWIGLA